MSINPGQIKTILAVRNDRFGEFLLIIPALRALKETFAGARLIAAVSPSVRELAGCVPFVDDIMVWGKKVHSFREKLKLAQELKRLKIDMAVMFNPSSESNLVTFLAGIPRRIGYARKWPFLLTVKIADEKHLGRKHEVEYNLDLVAAAGAKTGDKTLSLAIDEVNVDSLFNENGIENNEKIIAVHPFTSDPVKQWPLERFVELIKRLAREFNQKVVVIGGKEESAKSRQFFGIGADNKIINLTGLTTLKESAALLRRCSVLVSGDSGPVHLACCVKTPVIALFRNDLPGKTAKRWCPWGGGNAVIEKYSLDEITTEEVLVRVMDMVIGAV